MNDEALERTKAIFKASGMFPDGYAPRDELCNVLQRLGMDPCMGTLTAKLNALFDECGSDQDGQVKCDDFLDRISGIKSNPAKTFMEADAVCFDVDSTVTQEEGIDKMAARADKGGEVAQMTKQAMEGGLSFGSALEMRLNIIRPNRAFVEQVAAEPVPLTPGIKELVDELHCAGKQVFLISGGFREMISPVAMQLGIPKENIYANTILFDSNGAYAGFSRVEPTSQAGGKAKAVAEIISSYGFGKVAMVGDGATDMEAKPPAAVTVGFGGNVLRTKVRESADIYVCNFWQLQRIVRGKPQRAS